MPAVVDVQILREFEVELTFDDGLRMVVDLGPLLTGRLFGDLREDSALFRQVKVDPEARTIVWPNGADICPDLLYHDREPA